MKFITRMATLFCASALISSSLHGATSSAQGPSKSSPAVEQAIRAMFGVHEISEVAISPDGRRVAWVESLSGKNGAPSPNSAIFVADWRSDAVPLRVTAAAGGAAAAEKNISWSPDSKRLAFFSDANGTGQLQLYVAELSTGATKIATAPRQLTHIRGDVASPQWSPDGKTISFLFIQNAPRAAGPLAAETPDEGVVGTKIYEQRLALVDVATGHLRQISPKDMYVYEYDWSLDSKRIVATAAHGNGDDNWYIAQIYIFDALRLAEPHSIFQSEMQIGMPKWSPDGKSVAFIAGLMSDEPVVGGDIYTVPITGGDVRDATAGMKATANSITWAGDSRSIIFGEIVDGQTGVASVNLDSGAISTLWAGDQHIGAGFSVGISLARDSKTSAVVRQSFSQPPEVWAGPTGRWKQVTHLNRGLRPALGKVERLHWQTDIGRVQGWLVYPVDYNPAKKYGLVVSVHGGPAWANLSSWPTRWSYSAALPAAGYFVLYPNPRGSYGEGEQFTKANVKDFGGGDFKDIVAGVDAVLASLPVDPDRLGITGWSYGGYMSMWAVTQTNRFKAAVIGAGLSDWLSYYGENQIDKWMTFYFGDNVYNDPGVYAKSAPINFVKNVKTPSLILVGDSDGECPPPQSYEFWHALATFGVPTEFVIYPHEGHEFANPAHSRDVVNRAIAWFDEYLR